MNFDTLEIRDVGQIIRRYRVLSFGVILVSLAVFIVAAFLLPKKYKAKGTLSIFNSYFQTPLVRDFASEVYDSNELRAQRETLIKQGLSDEFLDRMGVDFGFYSKNGVNRTFEREMLQKRFEIYPLNATTFQVGFMSSDPVIAQAVASLTMDQVATSIIQQRRQNLTRLRDAIRERMEKLSLTLDPLADPMASNRPDILKAELARIDGQMKSLRTQYTERHPQVMKLRQRADLIKKWLDTYNRNPSGAGLEAKLGDVANKALVGGEPAQASKEVYEDLLRKFNLLNIALSIEEEKEAPYLSISERPSLPSAPLWPNKTLFAGWGLMTGLMISLFLMVVLEYLRGTQVSAPKFAAAMNVPFLGQIPNLGREDNNGRPNESS